MKLLEYLRGKKTYILSGLGVVVVALWALGVIDQDTADKLLVALGFGSVAALRASKK